jgi:hypothetical protein
MPAHPYSWVYQAGAAQRFQAQVGERVGQILACGVAAADHNRDRQPVGDILVEQQVQALDQRQARSG